MPRKRANRRKSPQRAKPVFRLPEVTVNWRLVGNSLLAVLAGTGLWAASTWVVERPIESVQIIGPFERVSAVQVEGAITPYVRTGFVGTNLEQLRTAVIDLPWVQDASVRRSWPSGLSISVVEEQAAARWGKDGLLNVYGELFVEHTTHIPAELPLLSGPAGTELQVAKRFFELDTQLEQRGLNAVALRVDERGSWHLETSNGMQVRFGAVAVEERMQRFFRALDKVLAPVANRVDYVDMRYTNGFSIGWKPVGRVKLAEDGETDPHA